MQQFRGNRLGPVDIRPDDKPHEIFLSMVTDPENVEIDVVNVLLQETNRYAEHRISMGNLKPRSRLQMWRPVCNEETKAFIELLLLMGIIQKPTLASYWETQDKLWLRRTPSFRSVMARDRFLAILSNLHASNNQKELPRDHPPYDPMHKVRPVIEVCNTAFRKNYRLGRDMYVDERIVEFKGRHNIVQHISKKKISSVGSQVNAYICHKRSFLLGKKLTHLQFHQEIVTCLVGEYKIQSRVFVRNGEEMGLRATPEHFLFEIPRGKRKKCVSCHKRKVRTWSKQCREGLCLGKCFKDYHKHKQREHEE
ncbi:unnamed protein product [Mytilus coruscus]|uniref:PiggyBac transposable element-derived protein domain-containing protein n=1 Tax=Mytilus coruscus TaxID=42192 RepID=A0A6J8B692_MYTCO|nr:unnamed protein product [Mytilus coruscus]